jgi:Homeodomain-like domain
MMMGRLEGLGIPVHRGLRQIARRLGVSKSTVHRWHAAWQLPLISLPARCPSGWVYVIAEPLLQEWERRQALRIQGEIRDGRRTNPLCYRRGRCPDCAILLKRFGRDRQ